MSLIRSTATALLEQLGSGALSAVELTRAFLDQIETHDEAVCAFLDVAAEQALRRAEETDRRRAAGGPLGRLAGIP
ncbi:MAG: amidase family protein, partial [Pirellulaceae bacterium]